jgi:hypothetical protein
MLSEEKSPFSPLNSWESLLVILKVFDPKWALNSWKSSHLIQPNENGYVDRENQFAQTNREAPFAVPKQEKKSLSPQPNCSLSLSLSLQRWGVGTKESAPVMLINCQWTQNFYICNIIYIFNRPPQYSVCSVLLYLGSFMNLNSHYFFTDH